MSEKIPRYSIGAVDEMIGVVRWDRDESGKCCFATDVSILESRLAEAEKERDALSARVRELEEALEKLLENAEIKGTRVVFGASWEDYNRAARALKGEA